MLTVLMKIVHYWDFRPVLLCSHVKVWRQFEPQLANRRQAARGFSFHIPRRVHRSWSNRLQLAALPLWVAGAEAGRPQSLAFNPLHLLYRRRSQRRTSA
jgi:hypothetical protein